MRFDALNKVAPAAQAGESPLLCYYYINSLFAPEAVLGLFVAERTLFSLAGRNHDVR